jgi:hypothetical protein
MEPTEQEIDAMAEEFRDVCRKTPSNAMDTLARHVQTNFTRNVPVTDDEIEALAAELYQIWRGTQGDAFHTCARHVLSRPAPPGTIRLGTGLTEAQRAMGMARMNLDADAYASAARALDRTTWGATAEGGPGMRAIHDRFLKMAADLRAAAEPPVDPRIEVVRAALDEMFYHSFYVGKDIAIAILAALDKMGGAGG